MASAGLLRPRSPIANETLHIVAASLFVRAGALQFARARITGTQAPALLGAALSVFGLLTFPLVAQAALQDSSSTAALPLAPRSLTMLAALGLVVVAVWSPTASQTSRAGRTALAWFSAVVITVLGLIGLGRWTGTDISLPERAESITALVTGIVCLCVAVAIGDRGRRSPVDAMPEVMIVVFLAGFMELSSAGSFYEANLATVAAGLGALIAAAATALGGLFLFEEATQDRRARHVVTEKLVGAEDLLAKNREWREEMTHDARNAITALRLASSVLTRPGSHLDENLHEQLGNAVMAEIGHIEHLIEPTTDLAMEDCALEDVLRPVVEVQRASGLVIMLNVDGVRARCSRDDLATVIQNLLVNARVHAPGSPVVIRVDRTGPTVEISVADFGPGIDDSVRARIFVRGERGTASGGAGLGLYVARNLMQEQGGDLRLRASSPVGATFVLTLQRALDLRDPRRGGPGVGQRDDDIPLEGAFGAPDMFR